MNDEITAERRSAFEEYRAHSGILKRRLLEHQADHSLTIGHVTFHVEFCDGTVLFGNWEASNGDSETDVPWHAHSNNEWFGLLVGTVSAEMKNGISRVLEIPEDYFFFPADQEHRMVFRGDARGWFVWVPPDPHAMANGDSRCSFRGVGSCKNSETCELMKSVLEDWE